MNILIVANFLLLKHVVCPECAEEISPVKTEKTEPGQKRGHKDNNITPHMTFVYSPSYFLSVTEMSF